MARAPEFFASDNAAGKRKEAGYEKNMKKNE